MRRSCIYTGNQLCFKRISVNHVQLEGGVEKIHVKQPSLVVAIHYFYITLHLAQVLRKSLGQGSGAVLRFISLNHRVGCALSGLTFPSRLLLGVLNAFLGGHSSALSPFVSGLVSLLVRHCVHLVSLLSPFVSLLVGHCVCLVSLLSPVLSPFLLVTVSALSPFCFLLTSFLSPFLLVTVSALFVGHLSPFCLPFLFRSSLSPFCLPSLSFCLPSCLPSFGLSGLVSLLVGHVSAVSPFWFLLSPFLSLFLLVTVSGLSPFCVLFSLLVSLPDSSQELGDKLSPFVSGLVSFLSPPLSRGANLPALGCCVRLSLAILYNCLPVLGLAILYICARNPLHVSPRSRLLYPPLPCNPFFVSQLWTVVPAFALQSFVSRLWRSKALVVECSDFEEHKLFGVYGGGI